MTERRQIIDPRNESHKLRIYREFLQWNAKYERLNDKFRVNPYKLVSVPAKPNQVDPRLSGTVKYIPSVYRDRTEEAFSDAYLRKVVTRERLTPGQKNRFAETSSNEVGWWHTDVIPRFSAGSLMHNRPRTSCNETKFASEYLRHAKINPFKVKNRN
mmetsp:Transcript_524/g.655  ORF Transcript_524/g.655 Transcript_524/m.655 type:complete len:157 (-) Transcript_524:3012-3482(-)|eukprot:CAMPEP_0204916582 /NCGR_PEP_ID=MMETSP1397-20131031/14345_1 /ASSEMBLY_ACC=CAM_ASM_000891 /TAXON_ID=49980 /ORGANISM="Climacostomum Climacostomum virens, Strain Stock W-24" /LENGTH=156 /DNA_ID=CAMNT_0052089115 /DNA_START=1282 /DNA_END=1752 /DNA_ORIENTATION=-